MWSDCETNAPFREFLTPPAVWRRTPHSPVAVARLPMSESRGRDRTMPPCGGGGCRRDLFHVIHKVPSGDSPYVKAKHAQLIEKDPSRAVALFWSAINAGDRVDSALKDMAIVMKQLNRSDEAIEAIKSFRHLCPYNSQESLDNILVELYKRSGRMEEEIEMLQQKLKNIEEDIACGGKRTKTARSQGKKVQITIEQERSRILGNLAWVYLQQHNYGLAEQHYRKSISLEPDKNKQCNLALCLMHMNKIQEAQTLLEEVRRASGGIEQMHDSYAKSYERASQMLTKLESEAATRSVEQDGHEKGSLPFLANQRTKEVTSSTGEVLHDCTKNPRTWTNGRTEKTVILGEQYEGSCWQNKSDNVGNFVECCQDRPRMISHGLRGDMQSSPQSAFVSDWRRDLYSESSGAQSHFGSNWSSTSETEGGSARRQTNPSPAPVLYTQPKRDSKTSNANNPSRAPVLYTQPRRDSWRSSGGDQRRVTFGENAVPRTSDNFMSHTIRNLIGELDSTDAKMETEPQKSVSSLPSPGGRGWGRSWKDIGRSDSPQTNWRRDDHRNGSWRKPSTEDGNASAPADSAAIVDKAGVLEASADNKQEASFGLAVCCTDNSTESARDNSFWENGSSNYSSMSWADIVEQEEQELSNREEPNQYDLGKGSNDENLDLNVIPKLKAFNLANGKEEAAVASRNWAVRRSLPFGPKKETDTKKRNRLQVFRDITPSLDSP